MIGITSYGGYIPQLRLNRMSAVESMGWFAPAIVMVAQGQRSFCNWDEDALTMAVAALRDCLQGKERDAIDALYLGSTTLPFADRLNAGIAKTALNLSDEVQGADFCSTLRAGTTALIEALSVVESKRRRNILVGATDMRRTKTAYFYELWYGDGAAALLVGEGDDVIAEYLGSYSVTHDFVDHVRGAGADYDYMWEERWARDEGYSKIIPQAVNGLLSKINLPIDQVDKIVYPCIFKAEHKKIAKNLGTDKVMDNLHEVCGETGAAHPFVMLVKALEEASPGERIVVAGFGQGCDALCFRVTDAIKDLAARRGINKSLDAGKKIESHTKFLKFRDLIETEMGVRAETPTKTAMTVLWRKRDLLLGLVGGKCTKCGTPQLPRMGICVNPACRAIGEQEPYAFAERQAEIKSFTGDLLAVSIDPPAMYGMVDFEGGGRFIADFTDCTQDDLQVGQKVTMSFRRRYVDRERGGLSGYFYKAVPEPMEGPKDAIRYDGQVAIVTGAGRGLGRTYALQLAERGAKVVVNDLGGGPDGSGEGSVADEVVKMIRDAGGEAVASYDSVATAEGGEAIVNKAIEAFGRVDILINNAGILRDKSLVKMDPESWHSVRAVHLDGAYNVTRPAFIEMRKQKYGRIVLTSSAAGLYGNFGQTNYGAVKMGLVGFMNTLKLEGEKYGVQVNTVAPIAATRLTEELLPENMKGKLTPESISPIVLYLCAEKCKETGMIFNAGMGYYNRVAIGAGPGVAVGDGKSPPTVEELHKSWEAINDLEAFQEFGTATAAFGPMMSAFSPKPQKKDKEEGLTVASIFERMADAFLADKAAGVSVIFQYEIAGAGSWNVVIEDGTCTVSEGTHPSPTTTIKMSDEDFVKLISKELNAMAAYTSGQLKIEGDLMKSQLIEKLFAF